MEACLERVLIAERIDHMLNKLKEKIINRKVNVGIIGLGYVGLPLAVTFAKQGFKVCGIDINKDRVIKLSRRHSYILDVPSSD